MAKKPAPDPRFDPRFQRGYEGPQPDAPPTPAVPTPIESPGIRAVAAPDAAGGPAAPRVASDDNDAWAPPRRNPFAIALLLGGVAMIAVGLWLAWTVASMSTYPDGNDKAAQAFGFVQNQLTPALVIAGLLGIIGWLVLGALAASGRRDD